MDWADDTAYCLNDLVDSMNAGFLASKELNVGRNSKAFRGIRLDIAETILSVDSRGQSRSPFQQKNRVVHSMLFVDRTFHSGLFDHQPVSLRFAGRARPFASRPISTNDSLRNSSSTIRSCISWSAKLESFWKVFSKHLLRATWAPRPLALCRKVSIELSAATGSPSSRACSLRLHCRHDGRIRD